MFTVDAQLGEHRHKYAAQDEKCNTSWWIFCHPVDNQTGLVQIIYGDWN